MSKNKVTTVSEQIRTLRGSKTFFEEVAKKIGIDTSLLGKIERNEKQPIKKQIKHVAKYFKLDEREMMKEFLCDQSAFRIFEEADLDTLRVTEKNVHYLKTKP